jgi:hypothetical protein
VAAASRHRDDVEQLHARIASVSSYIETFTRDDFAESHDRKIRCRG